MPRSLFPLLTLRTWSRQLLVFATIQCSGEQEETMTTTTTYCQEKVQADRLRLFQVQETTWIIPQVQRPWQPMLVALSLLVGWAWQAL